MDVFIEYVVLDNFAADALLLWASSATLRLRTKRWRIALGGAVGALCAVFSVFLQGIWLWLFKTVCLLCMCFVTVGWGKKLFWHILLTLAYTFVAGGAIVGLFGLLGVSYLDENGRFRSLNVPLFVYILAVMAVAFLCYSVVVYIRQAKKIAPHIVKIEVFLHKTYTLTGFCDSGNTLSFNGTPVCFVTKKFGNFAKYFAEQVLAHNAVDIPVATVTGGGSVKAVPAKLKIGGVVRQVYLALPIEKCQTSFDVLLNCEFCGG